MNPPATVFVYGSLKRGFWNHREFLGHTRFLGEGVLWGRLYGLPQGFPSVEVPKERILARGSWDFSGDAQVQRQQDFLGPPPEKPAGDWDRVHGEVFELPDAESDLPPLDVLEGFDPGAPSYYERVLVAACLKSEVRRVWVYVMFSPSNGLRIVDGKWPTPETPARQ